jgi:cytochrome c556
MFKLPGFSPDRFSISAYNQYPQYQMQPPKRCDLPQANGSSMPKPFAPLLFIILALSACSEVEDTRPGQPVKQRQQAFKEIIKSFEPMGTMLRTDRYQADKFTALAEELKARRDGPWSHFGPDTNYPPTKAKPAVWTQTAEFEKNRQAFFAATDDLVIAARSKEAGRIEAAYKTTYETCQTCHKIFKEK